MPWSSILSIAAPIVSNFLGASNSADAAQSASQAQVDATGKAVDEQRRQFDLTRGDTAGYRASGNAANSRLAYLLGIGGKGGISAGTGNVSDVANQIRQAFPTWSATGIPGQPGSDADIVQSFIKTAPQILSDTSLQQQWSYGQPELDKLKTLLPQAQSATSAMEDASGGDPSGYGSLLRRFSSSDLNADPVYNSGLQFGLDQGTKAINARAIAGGGYDSGATLKALTQFGNDYGSTKAEGAYNRFNADNTGIYNKLAGVSGAGQNAVNTVTTAGTNAAGNIENAYTDAGNARAAGIVGGANAYGSAAGSVGTTINNYNSQQTLQQLLKRNQPSDFSPYATQYSLSNPQYG